MTTAQPARRAVVLSTFDLPDAQQLMLYGCEDCACPVTNDQPTLRRTSPRFPQDLAEASRWVRGPEILELRLDPDHHVLFNPLAGGGVVVVNEPARQVLDLFRRPATLAEARQAWRGPAADLDAALRRLADLEIVQPPGAPSRLAFQDSTVLTAWLHVTNACNLRCPYCYVNKSGEGMDESVGRAAVEAVLRSAVDHGFRAVKLKYAGGEASLNHRLLLELHAYARALAGERGLRLHGTLLSNGVALPPALIEALKDHDIRVMISLDGVGAEHDAQRPFANGRPSFRFVERTISRLIEHGHAPHLSITITNRNLAGLAETVRFALERELTFSLNFFRDNDCAASFPDLRYQEQAMIAAVLDAFGVIEELLPPWSVLGAVLDRGQLLQPRRRSCGVGQDYVVIDQRGRVAKCHMEIERTRRRLQRRPPPVGPGGHRDGAQPRGRGEGGLPRLHLAVLVLGRLRGGHLPRHRPV